MAVSAFYLRTDELIRQGRIAEANQIARGVWAERDARSPSALTELAEVLRRTGSPELGLRVLFPVIRPDGPGSLVGSRDPNAVVEYAANLIRIGATSEAKRWLASVSEREAPMKPLFEGFALIHEWDFRGAIPRLEQASKSSRIRSYMRSIARLNTAQALVYEGRAEEASEQLDRLLVLSRVGDLKFMEFTLMNLIALNEVLNGTLARSQTAIAKVETGRSLDIESSDYDTFVYRKARAIYALRKTGVHRELERLVADARMRGQSEIARDGDLRLALHRGDVNGLAGVYFGTPFPSYRQTIDRLAQQKRMVIPEEYREGKPCDRLWSLAKDLRFKSGQLPERMMGLLVSERYRKFSTTHLACEVLHDRHFHHQTSAQQVHQLIKRLRGMLHGIHPELKIVNDERGYSIFLPRGFAVLHRRAPEKESSFVGRLRLKFGDREFASREAQTALGISQSQFSERLQAELRSGAIVASGGGRTTRYRIEL